MLAVDTMQFPVEHHLEYLTRMLRQHKTLVVTAPTGSGKSTCIPDYLEKYHLAFLQRPDDFIIVAVPRRVLAWSLAEWVASRRGEVVGESVGYQTGHERRFSDKTRIFFVTTGLQECREMLRHTGRRAVLIIDEIHEWDIHHEVLLYVAKYAVKSGQLRNLIVMSATIQIKQLSHYLGGAPVIKIPGNMFEVVEHPQYQGAMEDLVERLLREGKKTLVFLPGKREIRGFIEKLKDRKLDAVILPLHGEQTAAEQHLCFVEYEKPVCIVCTAVAQSGLTVPGVQAVVDSGQIRLTMAINGIDGLYTTLISFDDYLQRKGRAGRTGPGEYYPCYKKSDLPMHATPEIQRILLETAILKIKAFHGMDIEGLDLFHKPKTEEVRRAKQRLRALECFTARNEVTDIGREIAFLPLSPQLGRMVIEGRRLGVAEETITIAAIIEAKGITVSDDLLWWSRYCPEEKDSDLAAALAVYNAAIAELAANNSDPAAVQRVRKELESSGVDLRKLDNAIERRTKIAQSVRRSKYVCSAKESRENLLTAIRKGFCGHCFIQTDGGWVNGDGDVRVLSSSSGLPRDAKFLVGIPWNLDLEDSMPGSGTLFLIRLATVISKGDLPRELQNLYATASKAEHRELSLQGKKRKQDGNRLPSYGGRRR